MKDLKVSVNTKAKEGTITISVYNPSGEMVWEMSGSKFKDTQILTPEKGTWKVIFKIEDGKNGEIDFRITNKVF